MISFEGVCVNYRNPGPLRGEPRVGSALDVPFPADPVDPVQNSRGLSIIIFYNNSCTRCRKMITFLGAPLGALLPLRWSHMRSGPPVELHLEASWSLCWRQDGPSGAKMSQLGAKLAVKFGKLRTKRRTIYANSRSTARRPLCYFRS